LKVGQKILSGPEADILVGKRFTAAQYSARHDDSQCRVEAWQGSADGPLGGWFGTVGGQGSDYGLVKLPSVRLAKCCSTAWQTIGQVGNTDHENVTWGKAGRTRWVGKASA